MVELPCVDVQWWIGRELMRVDAARERTAMRRDFLQNGLEQT